MNEIIKYLLNNIDTIIPILGGIFALHLANTISDEALKKLPILGSRKAIKIIGVIVIVVAVIRLFVDVFG